MGMRLDVIQHFNGYRQFDYSLIKFKILIDFPPAHPSTKAVSNILSIRITSLIVLKSSTVAVANINPIIAPAKEHRLKND